jgi:hypothetical protein
MLRYQIRMPKSIVLEDIVSDMTVKAWLMINNNFDFSKHPMDYYEQFHNQVLTRMVELIKAYDTCGTQDDCTGGIDGKPWATGTGQEVHKDDCICHLFVGQELEQFLAEISTASMEIIRPILKPRTVSKVLSTIQMIFRCILGDYLCHNPKCGTTNLCQTAVQIYPWGRDRAGYTQ